MTYAIIALVLIIVVFFYLSKSRKPSESDILSAKAKVLAYYAINGTDCRKLIEAKKRRIAEVETTFDGILSGVESISNSQLQDICEGERLNAVKLNDWIAELTGATLKKYELAQKVFETAKAYIETNDERRLDGDEISEDDEDTRDEVEKALEASQNDVVRLRAELVDLGHKFD